MKHGAKKPDGDLLTRQKIAAMLGVSPTQFDRRYRQFIPDPLIAAEGTGRVALFKPGAIRAILDGLLDEERQRVRLAGGDPMLVGGGSSPALERYRAARAGKEEISLLQQQKQIVLVEDITVMFARFSSIVRRGMEQMGKRFGPEAQQLAEGVIESAAGTVERDLARKYGCDEEA